MPVTQPTLLDVAPPAISPVLPEFGFQSSGVGGRRIGNGMVRASAASPL
ncbi:Uncharacterised protein [Mycobacteroides abscessus subsp. abscessus]|nr:Uncharacterised protein [Mycobacteroides abscessus subsp. abscessus]